MKNEECGINKENVSRETDGQRGMERRAVHIFGVLCALMFILLLFLTLTSTGTNEAFLGNEREYTYIAKDSFLGNLCILTLALAAFGGMGLLLDCVSKNINTKFFCGITCFIMFAFSLYWLENSKSSPLGDQHFLCLCASDFNRGDFAVLEKGGYVARYPQQLGMITLLRIFFILFGDWNYHSFQLFSACMVPVLVYAAWKVTSYLSKGDKRAECLCLFLFLTCFPIYGYVPFVYGEISSTAVAMVAVWLFLKCLEQFSWIRVGGLGLMAGIAVQLRKNVLIVLAALAVVVAVKFLQKRDWRLLAVALGTWLGVMALQSAVDGIYHSRMDPEAEAIPASLFVVMGLNDDWGIPGWHNGYEYDTFGVCGDDVELANAQALRDLKTYMKLYAADPLYMADFFLRKINAQWNAPMYTCLIMTWTTDMDEGSLAEQVYQGALGKGIEKIMEIFQMAVYCGVLILLVSHRRRWLSVEKYVLLIAVFGGFLFSVIWEAKPRYVFPYYIMMLPYAAVGFGEVAGYLSCAIRFLMRKRQERAG